VRGRADNMTAGQVASGVAQLLPGAKVQRVLRLEKGYVNTNWLVDTSAGRYVAKVAPEGADLGKVRSACAASELAFAHGVLTPPLVAYADPYHALDARALRVYPYVGDRDGSEVGSLRPHEAARFFRGLGASVRRLHSVPIDSFTSRIDGSGPAFRTWQEYVAYRLDLIRRTIVRTDGCLDATVLQRTSDVVLELAARVSPHVQARLTHRDLYLDNARAWADGSFAGLLDFDMAEAWDPLIDLVKLEMWVFERWREAGDWFLEGHGVLDDEPALQERSMLVHLLEYLGGLPFWHARGETQLAGDYRNRLGHWMGMATAELS
jgi:aminoglycoside phosphotransferase (APT) family kinase protein